MTDENAPNDNSEPDLAPGANLREAREQAGVSLTSIAEQTLIPLARLEALEQDRYRAVGSMAYISGYARAYARVIGVEPRPYVAAFEAALRHERETTPEPDTVSGPVQWSNNRRKFWLASIATVVMLGVLLALVLLYRLGVDNVPVTQEAPPPSEDHSTAVIDPESSISLLPPLQPPAPAVGPEVAGDDVPPGVVTRRQAAVEDELEPPETLAPPAEPLPAPEDALLELSFTDECWVEVRDADGTLVVARLAQSGDNLRLSGSAPFDVLLGNAHAVSMAFNGEAISITPARGRDTLRLQVGS